MRKIILFLTVVLLSSCTCVLSQIPPQYIYITDSTCMEPIPDYRPLVVATDNCGPVTLVQSPEAGYILGFPGASKEVSIRAYDGSNNYAEIKFLVTLVDTIPPVIHVFDTIMLVDQEMERIGRLYDQADLAVAKKMQEFDDNFPYEELGIPKRDSIYHKQTMIISVAPALAMTGKGYRFWHWGAVGDTIVIK